MKKMLLTLALVLMSAGTALATEAPLPAEENAPATAAEPSEACKNLGSDLFDTPIRRVACTATANCGSQPPVACAGSGTCISVNRNCAAGINGYVKCDNVTTNCSHAPGCSAGCFDDFELCVDGCTDRDCLAECQEARSYCICQC